MAETSVKNNQLGSSFRDRDGFVFVENEEIFRQINLSYKDNYEHLVASGLLQDLFASKMLIKHDEVLQNQAQKESCYKIIKPTKISHISYPYEWSFGQLKDAALLTLKLQKQALKHNMSLKDASAYNVQFHKGKPIFIDSLSFEKYQENLPWVAYRQFCQHFLAPLLLMKHSNINLSSLLKIYIDGVPLGLANSILPLRAKFSLSTFLHIVVHSKMQKQFEKADFNYSQKSSFSKAKQLDIIENLEESVAKISLAKVDTEWGEYYTFTNYSDVAFDNKRNIIEQFLDTVKPQTLWDLGANNGLFSRLASNRGVNTVAFDIDPIAVEKNYSAIKVSGEENILPSLLDLTNPSPAIGWANQERMSLCQRGPVDIVMALALIHHISISNNVPFNKVASYFADFAKNIIIEFVPKSDSQVKKLLASRTDIFDDYNQENFEKQFSLYFNITSKIKVEGSERTLYLMQRKKV